MEKKQLFRHYDIFNGDTFLKFLKKIHAKFPKYYLFMDKASPHYKVKKVKSTLKMLCCMILKIQYYTIYFVLCCMIPYSKYI